MGDYCLPRAEKAVFLAYLVTDVSVNERVCEKERDGANLERWEFPVALNATLCTSC